MAEELPDAPWAAAPAADLPDAPWTAAPAPAFKPGEFQQRQHTYRGAIRAGSPELPAGAGADVEPRPDMQHDFGKTAKGIAKGIPASVAGGVLGDVEELGRTGINWVAGKEAVSPHTAIPTTVEGGYLGDRGIGVLPPATSEDEKSGMAVGSLFSGPPVSALYKGTRAGARAISARMPRALPPVEPAPPPSLVPFEMHPDAPVAVPRGEHARVMPADVPHTLPPETETIVPRGMGPSRAGVGADAAAGPLANISPTTLQRFKATLAEHGFTPWTIDQRLSEMSPHEFLAELSPSLRQELQQLATKTGDSKNQIHGTLTTRHADQPQRLNSLFDDAFGDWQNIAKRNRELTAEQKTNRARYKAFEDLTIPPTEAMTQMLPHLEREGVLKEAKLWAERRGVPLDVTKPESFTGRDWDLIKKALDSKIEGSLGNFDKHTAHSRYFTDLKKTLIHEIDNHPDPNIAGVYKAARDGWASPERLKDAYEFGKKLMHDSVDANELPYLLASHSAPELEAIATGMRYDLRHKMGRPGPQGRRTINQIMGDNNESKIRQVIGDEKADALNKGIQHEHDMHDLPADVLKGSQTRFGQDLTGKFDAAPTAAQKVGEAVGEVGELIHSPKKTLGKWAGKAATKHQEAKAEAAAQKFRNEYADLLLLQGPERDAVLRWIVNADLPKASGGRVIKRAEGGRAPKLDYDIQGSGGRGSDRHEMRASVPIGRDTELTGRAFAYPQTNGVGAPISPGSDWGATIGVRKGFEDGGIISGWVDGVADQDEPGQAEAARGVAARGVARGVQHRVPLGLLPPEGSGEAPPEAFPQKTWMMEPDLQAQQSGVLDLPPGAQLDDANRPFYPDTGRQIEMIKRPGLLPLAQTPDGPQFVMPKLLDLASNVMSPLAAGKVPVKAGEMVLGSGAVRRGVQSELPMDHASRMERARAAGWDMPWYHGGERMDRFTEKGMIDPKRATSGPMPFFTDNPEIASSYATKKVDTSLQKTDPGDSVANYFTVSPKAVFPGSRARTPITVEQSWQFLPSDVKREISDRARRIGYANKDRGDGPLTAHPPGEHAGPSSLDHWNYTLQQNRGNPLAALRDLWHDGGMLVGNESELADIYRLAGYPYPISEANAPWTEARGVFPAALRMKNPLHTDDANLLRSSVLPNLERAFKRDRTKLDPYSATDMWDKNNRWTPREWVSTAQDDLRKGDNSYVWTSIPDKVTKQLSQMGYDAILDLGGKGDPKNGHRVAVPFSPEQVRSLISARFDPAKDAAPVGRNQVLYSDTRNQVAGEVGHQIEKAAQPFYSTLERAVEGAKLQKGTPEQWAGYLRNQPGVKADEMDPLLGDWLKQQKGPITKEQIAEHIRENKIEVKDVVKGGERPAQWTVTSAGGPAGENLVMQFPTEAAAEAEQRRRQAEFPNAFHSRAELPTAGSRPKFEGYQLPGGENYRERLLTLPQRTEPWEKRLDDVNNRIDEITRMRASEHAAHPELRDEFDKLNAERGPLMQRFKEAKNTEFKSGHWDEPNVLAHVRMNDRMVEARGDNAPRKSLHLEEIQSDWHQKGRKGGYNDPAAARRTKDKLDAAGYPISNEDAMLAVRDGVISQEEALALRRQAVPDAPFKKTWHELALKSALRDAVEGGYDRLSWTPGEAQAERYDLSKHVDRLGYTKRPDGLYNFSAEKDGKSVLSEDAVTGDRIGEVFGKDIAKKIENNEGKVYDKHQGHVTAELTGLDLKVGGEGMKGFYDQIVPKALEKLTKKYGVKVKQGRTKVTDMPTSEYDKYPAGHPYKEKNYPLVHYIDIPQALKDDILKHGQPLFARGGAVKQKAKRAVIDTAQQLAAKSAIRRAMHGD